MNIQRHRLGFAVGMPHLRAGLLPGVRLGAAPPRAGTAGQPLSTDRKPRADIAGRQTGDMQSGFGAENRTPCK